MSALHAALLAVLATDPASRERTLTEILHAPLGLECGATGAWRALYAPSFRASSIITLRENADGGATLELVVGNVKRVERRQEPVSPARLAAFRDLMTSLEPEKLGVMRNEGGADGATMWGSVCPGPSTVEAWSPTDPRSGHHRFFRSFLDLGREVFRDELSVSVVEGLLPYISNEFVFHDEPGPPRVIRFEGASSNHKDALRKLFGSVGAAENVIVDLRNFSGAGTMFKPDFVALDRRKGRTVWVMGDVEYLSKMLGVDPKHMVPSMEEAKKRLSTP